MALERELFDNNQEVSNSIREISTARKEYLDTFFRVLKMVAGKGYVFFCDIKYDFSRWDERIVENYGFPSEYMYKAGKIWEQWVHPMDREEYTRSVEAAFNGENDNFALSYKIIDKNNNYVPCTCKGIIIRDHNGEPDHFGGVLYIHEDDTKVKISEERKQKLDSIFEALSIISDDSNVYVSDMHYNYCKLSEGLVEEFEIPSEYMYDATSIWEERVHLEDKQAYREQMDNILHFKKDRMELQYRIKKANGEYDLCSDLGVIVKDEKGHPEYFAGRLYNHTHHKYIDAMTGLHNQNRFFVDIQNIILNKKEVRIAIIGISKFSEINAVYGYNIGNKVLQNMGSYLSEHIGNIVVYNTLNFNYIINGIANILSKLSYTSKICRALSNVHGAEITYIIHISAIIECIIIYVGNVFGNDHCIEIIAASEGVFVNKCDIRTILEGYVLKTVAIFKGKRLHPCHLIAEYNLFDIINITEGISLDNDVCNSLIVVLDILEIYNFFSACIFYKHPDIILVGYKFIAVNLNSLKRLLIKRCMNYNSIQCNRAVAIRAKAKHKFGGIIYLYKIVA